MDAQNMLDLDITESTIKLSGPNGLGDNGYIVNVIARCHGGPNTSISICTIVPDAKDDAINKRSAIQQAKEIAQQFCKLKPDQFAFLNKP
jgi:hypothetical protein